MTASTNIKYIFYVDDEGDWSVGIPSTLDTIEISAPEHFKDTDDFEGYFKDCLQDYYENEVDIYTQSEWDALLEYKRRDNEDS